MPVRTLLARCRLRDDRGMALMEFIVAGALSMIVLSALGGFLISSMDAGSFTQGQSATLNDARNVMQKIEKETRGAIDISWCATDGTCLEVTAQTPTSAIEQVRYTYAESQLRRAEYDTDTDTWGEPLAMVERLGNTASQPVFVCDESTTYTRVNIDLYIEPTPQSNPNLNIQTSIRPRNALSAGCAA
jgi:type II secretory pathway component PulJ